MTDTDFDADFFEAESLADNPTAVSEALKDPAEPPELHDPQDGPVSLPAGFRRVISRDGGTAFEEVRSAWVRELNGEDEERIARTRLKDDYSAFLRTVLECGVEKLGEETPTKEDFNSLVLGDREFLLMEIARVTYGDELEYEKVGCPSCGEQVDVTLSIAEDIPVKRLAGEDDRTFDVRLRKGRVAVVTLPTGDIAGALGRAETAAEANTILITNCVREIRSADGKVIPVQGDEEAAKSLGLVDRQALVKAMSERMPGPQYNEVRFNHEPGCGEEIRLSITLADLFRGL